MKFSINTKELEAAIKKLDHVRPNKQKELPILENIKVIADYNSIKLIANDLINGLELEISLNDFKVTEPGEGILSNIANIKKSFKYLKELDSTIIINNSDFTLLNGDKEINNKTYLVEEFPESIEFIVSDSYTYNTKNLHNRIEKLLPAISKDDTRPILKGIHFKNNDMAALDGYRLHLNKDYSLTIINPFTANGEMLQIFNKLVPKKDTSVKINIMDKRYISLEFDDMKLTSRLLEGEYIDYNNFIPKEFKTTITADKTQLLESIEFLGNYCKEIQLQADQDNMTFKASTSEGIYKSNIKANRFNGNIIELIAFNNAYMTDALKAIESKNIKLQFNDRISPIIITSENELYLVLPIRLRNAA